MRTAMAAAALAAALCTPTLARAADAPAAWQLVGRQGMVQIVIVPTDQAGDAAAYEAQIARLCTPEQSCFVNFYANRTGVPLALPLPDEVAAQATARFRYSTKAGVRLLEWSCRVKSDAAGCF